MENQLIEAVPNFSEGRDKSVIDAICREISSVSGVQLLHVDMGYDANRTVLTYAGFPEAMLEATFNAVRKASELIDMHKQSGEHPRQGAIDVCPFVPLQNISIDETVELTKRLGKKVGNELGIPVYLYEYSATKPERRKLEFLRKGEYEGLKSKMQLPEWEPDFGPHIFNERSGNIIIGARKFLLAWNVNLKTKDVSMADKIARTIRESGYINENKERITGLLKNVKAIGWWMEEFNCCQVSVNITDFEATPIHVVFETVKIEAARYGIEVNGSELIGLIPQKALEIAGDFYAGNILLTLEEKLNLAIEKLGLSAVKPFVKNERVIEKILKLK